MLGMKKAFLLAVGAILFWAMSGGWAHAEEPGTLAPPAFSVAGQDTVSLSRRSVYWIDPQGGHRPEEVESALDSLPWRLRVRDQQSWKDGGALWIMFDVAVPGSVPWYLEVGTAIHDKVQLFHRDANGAWVVQEAGTGSPVSHWGVPGRLPTFRLAAGEPRTVRYLLRVEDERAEFVAPLNLLREDALRGRRELEQFIFGAYFGLAALVFLAALAHGTVFRDKAFLAFALYILLLGTGQLGRAGIGSQHFWPELLVWNGTLLALWPGAAMAAALWFVKVVTEPARLSRALDLGVWALIAAVLTATALHVVINTRISMMLVLSLTGLSLVALLGILAWAWADAQDRYLGLIALGFLPVVALAAFPLGRTFGLLPTNLLSRFGLFFGVALSLPVLYYALNMRLMARREGELRANALSHTDALTGLPHRQALVERLDTSLAHARSQKQQLAAFGVRIANLDAIAEEFGRDAAEKALVVAASHLRRAAVAFDMAARVGEREFAVLQEAPVTPELAASRAQQIVASGLRQVEALPAALTLKFHVTVALLPDPQLDGHGSLQWVLEGLDQILPDARKLIRPLNF
jgi:diguanylate cyclase (GGDEF)-like protein